MHSKTITAATGSLSKICKGPCSGRKVRRPKKIVEFPIALTASWVDPPSFAIALMLHARRHGDSLLHLQRAIVREGEAFDRKTLQDWAAGRKVPHSAFSFTVLERIEHRYRLPSDYLRSKLPKSGRAVRSNELSAIPRAERRRLAWHLPHDFDLRSHEERAEIIEWVRTVIISGATDYRRFQAEALKLRYALQFPRLDEIMDLPAERFRDASNGRVGASKNLVAEVADLIRFKTKTLTAIGEQRSGVWGGDTAAQKLEHLALMFGALSSPPEGPVAGLGLPVEHLSMAMLVFPTVWDWYLQWREVRRGFYTAWEINMLSLVLSLTRRDTG